MIARRVVVSGRVQGVGFRESLVAVAAGHGVAGWVRNRADGTVEAVLQGEEAPVDAVTAWCRRGPPAARVTGVAAEAIGLDPDLHRFERRPSL